MIVPYRVKPDSQKLNFLIYGDAGAGKTTFAAQAIDHPALRDVLFLNFEGGLFSVAARGDIDAIDITAVDQLAEIFEAFNSNDPSVAKYKTLVIDSGSELQALALDEAMRARGVLRSKRIKDYEHDENKPWPEDYNIVATRLKRLFRQFRDLPVNIIMTALAGEVRGDAPSKDEPGKVIEYSPNFTTAIRKSTVGMFDFMWYFYLSESDGERYILTSNKGKYKAKTRGYYFPEKLGQIVRNPNFKDIYDLILEYEVIDKEVLESANSFNPVVEPVKTKEELQEEVIEAVSEKTEEAKPNLFNVTTTPFQIKTKGGK